MSIITRINKAEKRIVDLYNKLKNLPSGGGGVQTISGDFVDNTDPLNPILNDPRPYKVYTALLTQSGTNAPVATVLENTIPGFSITPNRSFTGLYQLKPTSALDINKVYFDVINTQLFSGFIISKEITVGGILQISTKNGSTPTDGLLFKTPIEIRVYN